MGLPTLLVMATLTSATPPEVVAPNDIEDESQAIAWWAYHAGETGDDASVPLLIDVLERPPEHDRELVLAHVLDALVRLGADVPPAHLRPLVLGEEDALRNAALILLAQHPTRSRGVFLEALDAELSAAAWYLAANELARIKAKGFGAWLLRDLEIRVDITVVEPFSGFGLAGFGCGGAHGIIGRVARQGYPPRFVWRLLLGAEDLEGAELVSRGPRDVFAVRQENGWAGGRGMTPWAAVRLEYLSVLTGGPIALEEEYSETLVWRDDLDRLQGQVAEIEGRVRGHYQAMIDGLFRAGVITWEERKMPRKIDFDIDDQTSGEQLAGWKPVLSPVPKSKR